MSASRYHLKIFFKMQAAFYLPVFSIVFILSGCSPGDTEDEQTAFRVRSDFESELNSDRRWAGGLNEDVTMNVEQPFRIRFELESDAEASRERRFGLQYRRNSGEWTKVDAQRFPYPTLERSFYFEKSEVGEALQYWRVARGDSSAMEVTRNTEQSTFLQINTDDQEPLLGIGSYETFWEAKGYEATLRLSETNKSGAGIVFGYVKPENYCLVYLDPKGTIRVSCFLDGKETNITEEKRRITLGQWLDVEVEVDDEEVIIEFDDGEKFTANLGASIPSSPIGFYVPANGAADFQQFVVGGIPRTTRVSIIGTEAYKNGAQTTDLLAGSSASYKAGAGINFAEITPTLSEGGIQSEWEWPLVIRRFADGAVTNDPGDTFEFRMIYEDGTPIQTDNNPMVTVSVPKNLLGGTYPESPGRIGPWEASNGDLYFLMEPAETYNVLMSVKSTDEGESWQEVDGANRPATGDLEGFASDYADNTIHILHQTSNAVLYHSFRTSDHSTKPDTWHVRDDTVATPAEPPTQVASITVRSDGSIMAVYGGPNKIMYKLRSSDGTWGEAIVIDPDVPTGVLSGPMTVLGEDGLVHLAYTEIGKTEGKVWYRTIQPDGTLTPRVQLASGIGTYEGARGSILPLVFLPEINTAVVIYRLSSGKLWARRIIDNRLPTKAVQVSDRNVAQSPADSDQAAADAIAANGEVHVLFIEDNTGNIYYTHSNEAGAWEQSTLQIDSINAQWVRGMLLQRSDASNAYGYIYDAGSNGGSGMNRYGEVPLDGTDKN